MRRAAALLITAALLAADDSQAAEATVSLLGSELVVSSATGPLPGTALDGAILDLDLETGGHAAVRIDRSLVDPGIPEGDVILYDLSVEDAAGQWRPVCAPEADGAPHAILQPGPDGRIAIYCTAGALGKCIRFGYRPWAERAGVALAPYWEACVRMVRADYCGNGQPTTRDNMLIDLYDDIGIQTRADAPGLSFEAAWGAHGAVCVAHPRVPQKAPPSAITATCPRLLDRVGLECTEALARAIGMPLIYNASRGDGIPETQAPPQ